MDFVQIQMDFLFYMSGKTCAEFSCLVYDPPIILFFHLALGTLEICL